VRFGKTYNALWAVTAGGLNPQIPNFLAASTLERLFAENARRPATPAQLLL